MQPGDVVGIISMLDGLGHINDLIARGANTLVLRIPGPAVRELRQSDPNLGRAFEMQLAFRSRLLHERLAADSGMPIEARVARLLVALSSLYGEPSSEGLTLKIKISQEDLGDWLGVSRQGAAEGELLATDHCQQRWFAHGGAHLALTNSGATLGKARP